MLMTGFKMKLQQKSRNIQIIELKTPRLAHNFMFKKLIFQKKVFKLRKKTCLKKFLNVLSKNVSSNRAALLKENELRISTKFILES